MSFEDIFEDDLLAANPSSQSQSSTPLSLSGVSGAVAVSSPLRVAATAHSVVKFSCDTCAKILRSKSGLRRHMILHKLNDYNSRKPVEDDILASLPEIFNRVLVEIKQEPTVSTMGAEKKHFLEVLASTSGSTAHSALINAFAKPILQFLLVKTKVMPSAQYEEGLRQMNIMLANPLFSDEIMNMILCCVPEQSRDVSSIVLRRLIWRIMTKLMSCMQEIVFQSMRKTHSVAHNKYGMNEEEKATFKEHLGDLLRALYRFGMRTHNSVWNLRCQAIKERFLEAAKEISSEEFLHTKYWEKNVVSISDSALQFFIGLEGIIQSHLDKGSACSPEVIFDSLSNIENLYLFDCIRELTHGILSQDSAIDFLFDIVKSQTALSNKFDAKRQSEEASRKQKTSHVSLRTNLKRNPLAREAEFDLSTSSQGSKVTVHEKEVVVTEVGPGNSKKAPKGGKSTK